MEQAGPAVRFKTRRNALEALRKIWKSSMLSREQMRNEAMNDCTWL
jgi:hypothetical protein